MLVGTHQRIAEADDLVIEISNTRLERVDKFKCLGVLQDNTLGRTTQHMITRSRLGVLAVRLRFSPSELAKCSTILLSCHCSITVHLPGTAVGLGAKLTQIINRRATCTIEGRPIGTHILKSTLCWPSLQAYRNYLKWLLVHKCDSHIKINTWLA